jgi:hypothetical protein
MDSKDNTVFASPKRFYTAKEDSLHKRVFANECELEF